METVSEIDQVCNNLGGVVISLSVKRISVMPCFKKVQVV